ncbi:MAG: sulfite exporter TauE/SafE family protein [Candidatus Levybacteria bacterium]|nr:sulfite exporter TauE/SafE family protein [Candidatus Levybacteria bacterium]MDZ4228156.1 sulfite exporter TauE/SafE family protein [Candidatus Levybacteria bacterium]
MNLWVIFITGLTVGGLSCLAVQGGLLASVIAAKEEDEIEKGVNNRNAVFPTLAFLLAKLVAYTVLGFLLGAFGKAIGISQNVQIIMQFAAGIYMVAVGLNLLEVHPIFRYAVIQPPKFLTRRIRNQSKNKDLFAPAFLGAMTIFIPCGTTLAMEALAISSGNALLGAAIMSVFILGTVPLFFGIGWITSILGDNFRGKFLKVAAIAVLYLGIASMNGSLIAGGSPISLQSVTGDISIVFGGNNNTTQSNNIATTQNVEIIINSRGYSPNYIKVKKGLPVTITLKSQDAYSCASAFRIPSLGISRNLQPNDTQVVTFTPEQVGQIQFSCSMGMYAGVIEVI